MRALVYRGGVRRKRAMSDEVRDALARRSLELGGLVLVALAALAAVALATWSAFDPSINNASSGQVGNLLGAPGAFVSDILMQTFGLGSIALLFPIAAWGWRLVTHRGLDHERLRVAGWVLAALAVGYGIALIELVFLVD